MAQVIVFDDFYKEPEKVRQLALQASYRDVTGLNYPGFQSVNSFTSSALEKRFGEIIGRNLTIAADRMTFGTFRIMLKETASELNVHVDGHADWTGVLYLNPPNQCRGGTAFYKHKATGLEGPAEPGPCRVVEIDTRNAEAWSISQFVAMRFNRLVLFQGNKLFHCHTESFGTGKDDGRLTQNFFFNENK